MSLKRTAIVFSFVFLITALVLLLALHGVSRYLPVYVESKLLPEIARKGGISTYACDVRRIDFSGVDLGPLRIGEVKNPAIAIDSIQIDYTLSGLYRNEIERLALNGIELSCEYKNGKFGFQGFDLKAFLARLQSSSDTGPESYSARQLPVIKRLEVHNAVVVFNREENGLRIPIDLEVVPEDTGRGSATEKKFNCTLRLYPRDQEIAFFSKLLLPEKRILLEFEAKNIFFERFYEVIGFMPGFSLSGKADLNGTGVFQYDPFFVSSVSATARVHRVDAAYNSFRLKYARDTAEDAQPIRIEMSGRQGKEDTISGEYKVVAPFLSVSAAATDFQLPDVRINGEAKLNRPENDYEATATCTISTAEINGAAKSATFQISGVTVHSESVFGYSKGNINFSSGYNATAGDAELRTDAVTIRIPAISLNGEGGLDTSTGNGTPVVSYDITASDVFLTTSAASINIPVASLSGKAGAENDRPLKLDGMLAIRDAGLTTVGPKTKTTGIQGTIPLGWPSEGIGKTGKFFFKEIELEKMRLGSASGTVRQKGAGVAFNGVYDSSLLADLRLNFSGDAGVSSPRGRTAGVHFELAPYRTKGDIDLGRFYPPAGGVTVNGKFGLKGDVNFDSAGPKGSLSLSVEDGNVRMGEKKAAVEGIRTMLVLTDLFGIRSAPGQQLFFEKATLGTLDVGNGNIDFQIESAGSLFIEKSRFRWCNGNVHSQAMRISSGIDDYDLILFCDRLDLATILKQFGTVNADGTGSVNGRLPLRIHDGKLRIDDGFLFSTPGKGGAIHITGTEMLTRGIPPDTVQYAQIELAREALKDYVYDWVKLNLMSEGENLLLRLQFDGKPARVLPFVYKKEMGGFARVDASSEGSAFQGISLDVNFRVPLDRILQYKGLLDMIRKTP